MWTNIVLFMIIFSDTITIGLKFDMIIFYNLTAFLTSIMVKTIPLFGRNVQLLQSGLAFEVCFLDNHVLE